MFTKPWLAFTLVVALAAAAGCAPAPPAQDTAADEAKMKADLLAWFDYYGKADADGMANLYAEDAVMMPPGAPAATGRPAIRTVLNDEATKAKAAGVSLKNASVTGAGVNGDTGWLSGTFIVTDPSGSTIDSGGYVTVNRRINGHWLFIRDIWNSDRPATPPVPPVEAKK